ncbi:MAG: integrase, partial [Porphyromonas sp.]|nr:integrase [Porphyromonas sp.]
ISGTQIYAQITDQKIARDMERLIEKCENEKKQN